MKIDEYENLFNETAKENMRIFDIDDFKRDYKILYKTIIKSMISANQLGYKEAMKDSLNIIKGTK